MRLTGPPSLLGNAATIRPVFRGTPPGSNYQKGKWQGETVFRGRAFGCE